MLLDSRHCSRDYYDASPAKYTDKSKRSKKSKILPVTMNLVVGAHMWGNSNTRHSIYASPSRDGEDPNGPQNHHGERA